LQFNILTDIVTLPSSWSGYVHTHNLGICGLRPFVLRVYFINDTVSTAY